VSNNFDKKGKCLEDSDMDDDSRVGTQCATGTKHGITVFHEEKDAVTALQNAVDQFTKEIPRLEKEIANKQAKGKDVTKEQAELAAMKKVLPVFQVVISNLVQADSTLAKVAITDAKNTTVSDSKRAKIVASEIAEAEKAFAAAAKEVARHPERAIAQYSHAWEHAQLAIKFATLKVGH